MTEYASGTSKQCSALKDTLCNKWACSWNFCHLANKNAATAPQGITGALVVFLTFVTD